MNFIRLNTIALLTAILSVMTLLPSCNSANPAEELAVAEQSLSIGDPQRAKDICDKLAKSEARDKMTVDDLCRMSMIYMQLSDISDEGENIGMATGCMRQALETDADAAHKYYAAVSVDQEKYVVLLSAIVHTMNQASEFTFDEYEFENDSIDTDTSHEH